MSEQAVSMGPIQLRLWIGLLAGVSGLAGFAGGLLASRWFEPPPEPTGAFGRYREALVAEFDLSPERERVLASVLDEYQRRLEDLQARGLVPLADELARRGQQFQEVIQNRVLPEAQRERFAELAQPLPVP